VNRRLTVEAKRLLEEVVRRHRPELLSSLSKIDFETLSKDEALALMNAVTSELCASGLGPDDEPNERGYLLESLIDSLNPARAPAKKR